MKNPKCDDHPDRNLQLICCSKECPSRFTLQCTKCIQSKCKKHHWKDVTEFIEEMFEVCENQEAKEEKKQKDKPAENSFSEHHQNIGNIIRKMEERLDKLKNTLVSSAEEYGKSVAEALQPEKKEHNFNKVKATINSYRREEDRQKPTLENILKQLNDHVECDEEGILTLKHVPSENKQSSATHDAWTSAIQSLRQHAESIVQKLQTALEKESSDADPFEKQRKTLTSYVQELNEQVKQVKARIKQIPVLKQRIEDQALKIEAKDKKLRRYEEDAGKKSPEKEVPLSHKDSQKSEISEHLEKERKRANDRIIKLVGIRQSVVQRALTHVKKHNQETLETYKLTPNDDVFQMIKQEQLSNQGYYLNFTLATICDQLNFLGYKEVQKQGETFINLPLLRRRQPRPDELDPNLLFKAFFGVGSKRH